MGTPLGHNAAGLSPSAALAQLGVPEARAAKALAATGGRSVRIATDWINTHAQDPTLDQVQPRLYSLYMCPCKEQVGDEESLAQQLHSFWADSRREVGWNGAHNSVPHITLLSGIPCPDEKVQSFVSAVQNLVPNLSAELTSACREGLPLKKYVSPNFMGLFVRKREEAVLKSFCEALTHVLATSPLGLKAEATTQTPHLTLAYQLNAAQFDALNALVSALKPSAKAEWELRLYSHEERMKGTKMYKVLQQRPIKEQGDLEMMIGDFIFASSEPSPEDELEDLDWKIGTSWLTGCSGKFYCNLVERTEETSAWTCHLALPLMQNEGLVREKTKQRRAYFVRHGERVDFTFGGGWIPFCFSKDGKYCQRDLNLPVTVPFRQNSPASFLQDCPLTCIGVTQATLLGEALKTKAVSVKHAYVSPSLRCVQTCHSLLKGMGLQSSVKMCIEPGLFEWLAWYQRGEWMTVEEFSLAGYNVNSCYKPYISAEELQNEEKESCEQYYTRSFFVAQCILQATSTRQKKSSFMDRSRQHSAMAQETEGIEEQNGGNVLFVGHAATLDACTRQLVGETPRDADEMIQIVRKVPYCALGVVEENQKSNAQDDNKAWKLIEPPVPAFTHTNNIRFDWKVLQSDGCTTNALLK